MDPRELEPRLPDPTAGAAPVADPAGDLDFEPRPPVTTADPLQRRLIPGELAVLAVMAVIVLVGAWVVLEFAGMVTEPFDPSPSPAASLTAGVSPSPRSSTGSPPGSPPASASASATAPRPSPTSAPTPVPSNPTLALTPGDAVAGRWRRIAEPPIGGRTSAAAAWTGDEMLVWGGFNGEARWGDGGAYDPAANTWRRLPKSPMTARMSPASAWTGTELLVWGGYRVRFADDGAAYNPATNRWRTLPAAPLEPGLPSGAWTGDRFFVVTDAPGAALYDPAENTWDALLRPPLEDGILTAVAAGDRVFVIRHGIDAGQPRAVAELVLADRSWRRLADGPPAGDGAPATVVAAGPLLIVGDAVFDTDREQWSMLDLSTCRFQAETSVAATDALVLSPAAAVDLAAAACRAMPRIPNRPDGGARLQPVSVWTGRDWIVWSGASGEASGTYPNDGVAFRPTNP